jgi:NhaA family Na+:H+ antiporter
MLGAVISIRSTVRDFLRLEAAGGILLFAGGAVAMVCANTVAAELYGYFLGTPVQIRFGAFEIAKPLLLWINDGLMAVFFLLVGLELKREVLRGKLSRPSQVALPALAAAGGMLAPGLIYAGLNWGNELTMRGWAIPTATDIAFAVGVLALLGSRVPPALKLFVLTLAILDDLGAILVIAFFYTEKIALGALGVAAVAVAALAVLNRRGVLEIQPYLFIGLVLWAAVLKSGIHATIAGVLLAIFIPLRVPDDPPPLVRLEHELHEVVSFGILPLFAFANSGVSLEGVTLAVLLEKAPAGIAGGLVIGKLVGVFGTSWLAIRLGIARLPEGVGWMHLLGAALLCGIGFTMSLFIATLAFQGEAAQLALASRLGILSGSIVAGLAAYLVLRFAAAKRTPQSAQ